jgi:cytosine/adenosine deaminase-related metal-dependent hydrolase
MRGCVLSTAAFCTIGAVAPAPPGPPAALPPPAALVIRGGYVLTMDPAAGDLPAADVHIADGQIAAVGPGLAVPPGTAELDAAGMIIAPGLVDTHWHMWNTLLRSMSADPSGPGYFKVMIGGGRAYGPGDIYAGTRLACAEAISSGITTVHDWCHNVRGPGYAEAGVRALAEAGLRARFSYGVPAGHPNDQAMDTGGLERLHRDWDACSAGGRLSLGMAWRGPGGSNPAVRVPEPVYRREIEAARALGIPVTVHASGPRTAQGQIAVLAAGGLLGPDLQVVHANCATGDEVAALAATGTQVSISPHSELLIGYGLPRTAELLAAGIGIGLSVDSTVLTGNADMFSIMKVTQGIVNALAGAEFAMTHRQALSLGTIEGARSLGLGEVTGSLTPGKRADVICVSTSEPNLGVLTDPAHMLVTAAQPANVDTVIVDGRVLKQAGALTTTDLAQVRNDARRALAGVRARAAG